MRRWLRTTRRLFFVALVIVLVLSAAGAVYQALTVRRESARFPPPGQLVDIGGRRLHLICIGHGQPTVIFEPSGFGNALSSEAARVAISAKTRVCSYDRMGMGWSDPGPSVVTIGQLVDDLERLLDRAGLDPPYILVPASVGGLSAELFARRHPDQVAGLVFLDTATSDVLERLASRQSWMITLAACSVPLAARLGLLRLLDPFRLRRERSEGAARTIARLYRPEPMATLCGLVRGVPQTLEQFRAAPPLSSNVPLVVLIAETDVGLAPPGVRLGLVSTAERHELFKLFARRSSQGTWRVVPGSGHLIAGSHPHEVASTVLEMLAKIREKTPVSR